MTLYGKALAAGVVWLLCAARLAATPPNVLFLAVDDMRDYVNCLGGYAGQVHTPSIDALASQGVLFTNAHCPSPKCAPSRAATLTGLRPSTTGLYDNGHWWLPNLPEVVTIPEHFRRHGYQAVGAGKIFHHTAGNHPPKVWHRFQRIEFRNDPWFRGSQLNYPWSRPRPNPPGFPFSGIAGLGHENDWGVLPIPDADYDDARSVQFALDFLHGPHDGPFFLAVGLFRPHLPWYVPRRHFERYPLDEIQLPERREDDLADVPAVGQALAAARRSDLEEIVRQEGWKHAIRAYLASISYADEQLGRVLRALDDGPYAENTVVVLWSDHGWHLGEKAHWHKSTLWEAATRVPLVIRAPAVVPARCQRPVNLIDLFPTLCALCDVPAPPQGDGVSLVPLLEDPRATWTRPTVIEFRRGNAAVRSERYRYIRYHDGGEELYDHQTDPHEFENLAQQADLANEKARLAQWLPQRWAATAPTKGAFRFDVPSFTWTHKETGKVTRGK